MVIETWVITAVMAGLGPSHQVSSGFGHFSIFRLARLVRMLRMARVARLLRMVPELVVILRGIGAAIRSVGFFILLTAIIIYVFAVGFTQITKDNDAGERYFSSVPHA